VLRRTHHQVRRWAGASCDQGGGFHVVIPPGGMGGDADSAGLVARDALRAELRGHGGEDIDAPAGQEV
jgi:hypothetical protein